MANPLFTDEQWQAIHKLFEERLSRPGMLTNSSYSTKSAQKSIEQFEQYFENLSPELTGADKDALFAIRNAFTNLRHTTYQAASQMEVLYRKFKLKPATALIEHLNNRRDDPTFKELIEQLQALQAKLTQFHSTYFWYEMRKRAIISTIFGGSVIILARVVSDLFPDTIWSRLLYFIGIALLIGGIITFGLTTFLKTHRDPTRTMRYLGDIHKQIDKIRFQLEDLKASIFEDTRHESMQQELDCVIESATQLKLLCFP